MKVEYPKIDQCQSEQDRPINEIVIGRSCILTVLHVRWRRYIPNELHQKVDAEHDLNVIFAEPVVNLQDICQYKASR